MKKRIVLWSSICLGLLLSLFIPIYAEDDSIPIYNYVNDYAGILDEETEAELNASGQKFAQETGSQIILITTDSLHGKDPMKVAADSGNHYGIGNSDLDNGVVILVSMDDRQRFVATGSGIQGTLTDIAVEHLQQKYLVPAFQAGDYQKGLTDLYYGLMDAIQYGVDEGELQAYQESQEDPWWVFALAFGMMALIFGIIGFAFYSIFKKKIILAPGEKFQLSYPGWNFQDPKVICIASTPEIASVSKTGLITAKKLGKCKIKCINKEEQVRFMYIQVKKKSASYAQNVKYMNQLFKTAYIISSSSDPDGFGSSGSGGFSSGGGSSFSGGGGSFNGGGSGGHW